IDATVAMAASSRLAYLVSYFANPGGDWQGALIKYHRSVARPATTQPRRDRVRDYEGPRILVSETQCARSARLGRPPYILLNAAAPRLRPSPQKGNEARRSARAPPFPASPSERRL